MHTSKRNVARSGRFSIKLGAGVAFFVLNLAGGLLPAAQAASFQCGKHQSFSEKAVCSDPDLSHLDDKLAETYKRALDVALDKQAIEDARVQQWLWRQHNCDDRACVQNWYERRISELEADYNQGKKAQAVAFEDNLARQDLAPSARIAVRAIQTSGSP